MKIYIWKNHLQQGEIQANSIHHAKALLVTNHIEWLTIHRKITLFPLFPSYQRKEINLILQQLSQLISANLSLLQALKTIKSRHYSSHIQQLLNDIIHHITDGHPLSEILNHYPQYFSPLVCELTYLGEMSGNLDRMLQTIALYQQKSRVIKNKMTSAFIYPCTIVITTAVIVFFMLNYVIPEFADFYHNFSTPLPAITQALLDISQALQTHGLLFLSSSFLSLGLIAMIIKKNTYFNYLFAKLILELPYIGKFVQKTILLRSLRALSVLLSSGIPLLSAIRLTKNICQHPIFAAIFTRVATQIEIGHSLTDCFATEKYIPYFLQELIKAGEASGTLSDMLIKASELYEEELTYQVQRLHTLLEPILLILVSAIVSFILFSLYLPLFNIGNII